MSILLLQNQFTSDHYKALYAVCIRKGLFVDSRGIMHSLYIQKLRFMSNHADDDPSLTG